MSNRIFTLVLLALASHVALAQAIPAKNENISALITFGPKATPNFGDDDHVQSFFFQIPADRKDPFFIRVFDPETSGEDDHMVGGSYNSAMRFSVYGGEGAHSLQDCKSVDPIGQYDAGELLDSKVFTQTSKYDGGWYTFGPFMPAQGEYDKALDLVYFKIITKGLKGDDGNLYKYFLSQNPEKNVPLSGANAFTYEYTFRLKDPNSITHMYPFVDQETTAIKQSNFDFDNNGSIKIFSRTKNGVECKTSGDSNWIESIHPISENEKNNCQDIQIIRGEGDYNNDMAFYVLNQYDQAVKFFSSPIGKIKFEYHVEITPK